MDVEKINIDRLSDIVAAANNHGKTYHRGSMIQFIPNPTNDDIARARAIYNVAGISWIEKVSIAKQG